MTHSIVSEELDLLGRVNRILAESPEAPPPSEAPIIEELRRLRELLISRQESKDAVSLNEQWHRQNSLLEQLRTSRSAPKVDTRSPYFGHLQLRENGQIRDLCLGRATCIRRGVRIVDWRNAPVSRLFYRYAQGEEYEEEIAGRVRVGEVVSRRTVTIRETLLERIDAPEGTFTMAPEASSGWKRIERETARLAGGEGSALRAHRPKAGDSAELGLDGAGGRRRADKRLPEITGLIDPEQFSLITRPKPGFLTIRGAAGSGKTTVALHRIAYLAYDDPEIDSKRTLFVVFSPGLRNYVSHVLPALGVGAVAIRTWHEWAHQQRLRHFPALPKSQRHDAPSVVQRLKLAPALSVALAEQVARVEGPATAEQAVDDWASVLVQTELLERVFEERGAGDISRDAIASFVAWNRQRLDELFAWQLGDSETDAALEPEDDALLLRAWQLRVGPLRAGKRVLRHRHVVVDEVQDFAPLEVQVLLDTLDESRSLTLSGDAQQHIVPGSGFTSWSGFLRELGVPGGEVETLRVSYRSSQEIMDFSARVLGDLRDPELPTQATRSGPPVEFFRFTELGACVSFLSDALRRLSDQEPMASVALLTPSPEVSDEYFEGLTDGDVPRLRRVENQEFGFIPGIEITEIEQVKGLEFDYVIVVDASAGQFPDSPLSRRRLNVAATRAVHQLWVSCVGTPSPLLEAFRGASE
ncbi:MAG: 3'-5' exonuclease [Myxococcota bacterium]|nr:DNA helicase UvrD [Deltaproteobacteria bacterium]MDP6074905.1 3'-5' exonuclease [Myxococcota bacterium]MDP6241872.1 3'-5' exonuclease [Myxococcota bacterium]MDP7074324.1 3'-5' exonuclease [Myxococcota bacterium]MDP7300868.1 3'-5' exonuclease [Myxococcota bacterium]